MTHLGGGIKDWSLDVSGQPWDAIFIPDPHRVSSGHLGQWSSLILPSALPCFFPPDSTVLTPRAPLIHIPALNSIRVCIPENQPATHIRKPSSIWGGFLLKITGYTCIYNILKSPNKTQNGRNKDLLCECGYLWFKIHNLMLSDQVHLSYMLITKENYMSNHIKLPLYHL